MAEAQPAVPIALAAFLESGIPLVVGTRDSEARPDCAFAVGLRVHPDRGHVTVFLPSAAAARSIENLGANGAVAVTASRPMDLHTLQLKGRAVRIGAAPDGERAFVAAYRDALAGHLEAVGMSRSLTHRLTVWPCVAVEIEVTEMYEQTPGPTAGALLGAP